MSYADFLAAKQRRHGEHGRPCDPGDVNPWLKNWQRKIVAWAVRKGRAALWEDTGLGKTVQQIEWARLSGDRALIVAPLAVCQQTIREGAKIGLDLRYLREDDGAPGLIVTNYEMADRFDPTTLDAVVLDEASILKQSDGKTRTKLIRHFAATPARLACTATPAPNDPEELTSQAEFLGVMPRVEMLAAYFVHDDAGWRLKRHAVEPMYRWMTSWAVALRRPSDLGYSDDGYILPPLNVIPEIVHVEMEAPDGELFRADIGGVGGRAQVRKETLAERVQRAVELVNESHLQSTSNGFDVKLAECRGSQSTKPIDEPAWKPTPNTEHGTKSSNGAGLAPPRKTASTCGSTTASTPKSGSSGPPSSELPTTLGGGSGTPQTPSTASRSKPASRPSLRNGGATPFSAGSTASGPTSSMLWSSDRAADAPSAERSSETAPAAASPSTTVTTVAVSEGSSAPAATEDSATSVMTTPSFSAPPITSLEPWIIWVGLNAEQDAIAAALGNRAFSVTGSMSPEEKVRLLYAWIDGERPVMISKTSILGMGVNMQRCANMAFVGLSDSWEQYYQAIRRCWRYGQTRPVNAHIIVSQLEGQIVSNVVRKEKQTSRMVDGLVAAMHTEWSAR